MLNKQRSYGVEQRFGFSAAEVDNFREFIRAEKHAGFVQKTKSFGISPCSSAPMKMRD